MPSCDACGACGACSKEVIKIVEYTPKMYQEEVDKLKAIINALDKEKRNKEEEIRKLEYKGDLIRRDIHKLIEDEL